MRTVSASNGTNIAKVKTKSTPPGYNKARRDQCKFLLMLTAVLLVTGGSLLSILTAAGAVLCIKEGTIASTKNMKWLTLSFISFCASLSSLILDKGAAFVDEEKAYGLKISLWLGAKAIQTGWGMTLALFLVSAFTSKNEKQQ